MSVFSGKCDLYDHMGGCGGWYDANGNPTTMGDNKTNVYKSDEYRDFLAFKKRTNGTLHQHKKIEVTDYNLRFVKDHCTGFDFTKHFIRVEDKRTKEGYREKSFYTYKYWGKEYTSLKDINKRGVYITIDIHFNTILDLIPYYPYIVSSSAITTNEDGTRSEYVIISRESFPIRERDEFIQNGWNSSWESYARRLQNHYREIVLKYFNPYFNSNCREHIEELTFDENSRARTSKPIDENFDVDWYFDGEAKPHLTAPYVIDYDKGEIEMHKGDYGTDEYEGCLGHTMKVKYVEKIEFPLDLG